MALELIAGPPAGTYPVTLEEAKIHVRQDPSMGTLEDGLITRLIAAATASAEQFTHRQLITASWRLVLDAFPCGEIQIPKPPLQAKPVVKYRQASDGAEVTLDAATYDADLPSGPTAAMGAIVPAYLQSWPITWPGINAVRIEFGAGYGLAVAVPDGIKQAILQLVGEAYQRREDSIVNATVLPVSHTAELWLWPFRAF